MFTGLIEAVGRVEAVDTRGAGHRLSVETPLAAELALGDSIAVNGVCLTVVDRSSSAFSVDVSPETLRVTTLGAWTADRRVNLERPLRADQRLGGHFVLGHVDAVTTLLSSKPESDCYWLEFMLPESLLPYVIPKGSVTIDGVSLTLAALGETNFGVQIVPHTWTHTALSDLTAGATVNIEADVLGKYAVRIMSLPGESSSAPVWRKE